MRRVNGSPMYRRLSLAVVGSAVLLLSTLVLLAGETRAQTGDISGAVTYYGSLAGVIPIQLSVYTTTVQPLPQPGSTTQATSADSAYTFPDVEDGTYFVFAYLDIDGDSILDTGVEPFAWYDYEGNGQPDPVVVLGGSAGSIDILLTDVWQPLGGPLGQVNALVGPAGPDGTLFAAVGHPHGGGQTVVYTTTPGTEGWTRVYSGTGSTLHAMAASGTAVYAVGETSTAKGTVVASQDGGITWAEAYTDTSGDNRAFRAVTRAADGPGTVYVAGVEQGPSTSYSRNGVVYRSHNGGAVWSQVLTVTDGDLYAVAANPVTPTTVYAGGYAQQPDGQVAAVYRSEDAGAHWTLVLTDTYGASQQFTDLAVHPMTPTLVYAGSQTPKAVYRSRDSGLTWTRVYTDRGFRLALDPPSGVYAADDWRELAYSADGGDTWTPRVGGTLTPDVMQALLVDTTSPSRTVAIGTRKDGAFQSTDGGQTWSDWNEGIAPSTAPLDIAVDPQTSQRIFVAAGCDGVWRTADGGGTWERRSGGCVNSVAIHPQDNSIVYAGVDASSADALLRSADAGDTFGAIVTGTADITAIAVSPADTDRVLAGGRDGGASLLLASDDNGLTWSPVFTQEDSGITALAYDPASLDTALLGLTDTGVAPSTAGIYRTADGGTTWVLVYGAGSGSIHSIAFDSQQTGVVYATDDHSVLKSVDGGLTWLPPIRSFAEANRNLLAMDERLAGHLYLAGPGHIAETIDGGLTWSDWSAPINQGTEGQTATALAVGEGSITQTLYAGFSGVWVYTRPSPRASDFTTERVLGGLSQPTAIDWAPNGHMYIAHQGGRVLTYVDDTLTTFIDLSGEVNNNWNRGLIGIDVHPDFPTQPYVYLLYTYDPPELPGAPGTVDGPDGNGARVSRLVRVQADASQDYRTAVPGTKQVILGANSTITTTGDPADAGGEDGTSPACTELDGSATLNCLPSEGPSHSIGWLEFGHDGYLWVTNGEGAPYINPETRAVRSQDVDSLGGKILRIDPVTGEGAPGNPYYEELDPGSNRSRVWALGLRNPFRFALHPVSNTIYVGDVGWYSWEELNFGGIGMNYGWPCYEGGASGNVRHSLYESFAGTAGTCDPLYDAEPDNGVDAPLYSYQNLAGAAIVVGDFYTGTRYPSTYLGSLFIADYDERWIKVVTLGDGDTATAQTLLEDISALGGPVQLTLGPDGYFYYVALNPDPSGESEIRRVLYTSAPSVEVGADRLYGRVPHTVRFTRTLSSESQQLAHLWTFGDGASATEPAPVHTYTLDGTYTAILTITTPQGKSSSDALTIVVGDEPPTVTINAPASGSVYTMGTQLAFSGSAFDSKDDQSVPTADLQWNARLLYNGHFHPDFFTLAGVAAGTIDVPLHNDNTTLFVCLTATDSAGLADTECVELLPEAVPYTFGSDPAGAAIKYDGTTYTAPFTISMMVNAPRTIEASAAFASLPFASWSDNGAMIHTIVGQPSPQRLTALYRLRAWLPLVLRSAGP